MPDIFLLMKCGIWWSLSWSKMSLQLFRAGTLPARVICTGYSRGQGVEVPGIFIPWDLDKRRGSLIFGQFLTIRTYHKCGMESVSIPASGIFIFSHAVADADLCENILRLCRVLFYLPADICHVDAKNLIVAVRIRSPDSVHDEFIGQNPS